MTAVPQRGRSIAGLLVASGLVLLSCALGATMALKILAALDGASVVRNVVFAALEAGLLLMLIARRCRRRACIGVIALCSAGIVIALFWPGVRCGCLGPVAMTRDDHLLLCGLCGGLATFLHSTACGSAAGPGAA